MQTAAIIQESIGQVVRLPHEFEMPGQRVFIRKIGNLLVLIPEENPWQTLFDSLALFTDDYMDERALAPQQEQIREELFAAVAIGKAI